MAWSNQLVFQEVSKLPEEIYGLKAAEGEWPVGRILTHFIGAAEWYKYCSTGVKWEDDIPIKNHQILLSEVKRLAKLDEILINQASREDGREADVRIGDRIDDQRHEQREAGQRAGQPEHEESGGPRTPKSTGTVENRSSTQL